MNSIIKRDCTFDYLKTIGLMCIIFAHIDPPGVLFQLRNFDVPLMIIISVFLSLRGINKDSFSYIPYVMNRTKRLIIPTWMFLTVYYIIHNIIFNSGYSLKTILASFLLVGGIGYVWIIRIYIYVAIVTPLLNRLNRVGNKIYFILGIVFYTLYQLLVFFTQNLTGITSVLVKITVLDFLGYSFIVYVAVLAARLTNKKLIYLSSTFGGIFILGMFLTNFTPTQAYKYPIQLYYMSYAFFISFTLYIFFRKLGLKSNKFIEFCSKNSMWIYLWHIMYVDIINRYISGSGSMFLLRFLMICLLSILTVVLQNYIIQSIEERKCSFMHKSKSINESS